MFGEIPPVLRSLPRLLPTRPKTPVSFLIRTRPSVWAFDESRIDDGALKDQPSYVDLKVQVLPGLPDFLDLASAPRQGLARKEQVLSLFALHRMAEKVAPFQTRHYVAVPKPTPRLLLKYIRGSLYGVN